MQTASYLLLGLAAASAAWAGYAYTTRDRATPPMAVGDNDHDLGSIGLGRHRFTSPVANPGPGSARIVGYGIGDISEIENCCYGSHLEPPFTVAAGESYPFEYHLDLYEPGPFRATMFLYLEEAGTLRAVPLSVRGTCVVPTEASDGPPKP